MVGSFDNKELIKLNHKLVHFSILIYPFHVKPTSKYLKIEFFIHFLVYNSKEIIKLKVKSNGFSGSI